MNKKYDVVIAGAGVAGLLASNVLADAGNTVLLLESDKKFAGGNTVYGAGEILSVRDAVYARAALQQYQYVCNLKNESKLRSWVLHKFDALEESIPSLHRALQAWGVEVSGSFKQNKRDASDGGLGIACAAAVDAKRLEKRYIKKLRSLANYKIFQRVHLPKERLKALNTSSLHSVLGVSAELLRYFFDYPERLNSKEDRRICDGAAWVACLLDRVANHPQVAYAQFAKIHDIQVCNRQLLGMGFVRNEEAIEVQCDALILATGDYLQDVDYAQMVFGKALATQQHDWNTLLSNSADGVELAELAGGAVVRMYDLYEKLVHISEDFETNQAQVIDIEKELAQPDCLLLERNGFVVDAQSATERKAAYKRAWDALEATAEAQLRAGEEATGKAAGAVQLNLLEPEDVVKPKCVSDEAIQAPLYAIFDSQFRAKKTFGRLLPSSLMPDDMLSDTYWDKVLYKADSIGNLAEKIGVEVQHIERALASHNRMAKMMRVGADVEIGVQEERALEETVGVPGQNGVDVGNQVTKVEKSCGENNQISQHSHEQIGVAPFYAAPVWPGNAGSRGGVKTNADGQVLTSRGYKIGGLYAVGACAASVLDTYTPATLEGAALPELDEDALELTEVMVTAYRAAMHAADLPLV